MLNGRYWVRTSDPFRVKEVRYHCANRPWLLTITSAPQKIQACRKNFFCGGRGEGVQGCRGAGGVLGLTHSESVRSWGATDEPEGPLNVGAIRESPLHLGFYFQICVSPINITNCAPTKTCPTLITYYLLLITYYLPR